MATDILASYKGRRRALRRTWRRPGLLRLPALPSIWRSLFFADDQAVLAGDFPMTRVEVEDVLAGQITEQVQSGVIDVAITAAPAKSLEASMSASGIQIRCRSRRHVLLRAPASPPTARQARRAVA